MPDHGNPIAPAWRGSATWTSMRTSPQVRTASGPVLAALRNLAITILLTATALGTLGPVGRSHIT